jgi:hypothetical protein
LLRKNKERVKVPNGIYMTITIPGLRRISEIDDLVWLEDMLSSAKEQEIKLSVYSKALEERVRELKNKSKEVV